MEEQETKFKPKKRKQFRQRIKEDSDDDIEEVRCDWFFIFEGLFGSACFTYPSNEHIWKLCSSNSEADYWWVHKEKNI